MGRPVSMIYGYFALLVAAQVVGLVGLRRHGHELGFSAAVAALAGVAFTCGGLAAQSLT